MKSLVLGLCLALLAGCYSYSGNVGVIRPGYGGYGGGWGHYGGGWGHNNVAVINNRGFGGGYYHPGRW